MFEIYIFNKIEENLESALNLMLYSIKTVSTSTIKFISRFFYLEIKLMFNICQVLVDWL